MQLMLVSPWLECRESEIIALNENVAGTEAKNKAAPESEDPPLPRAVSNGLYTICK